MRWLREHPQEHRGRRKHGIHRHPHYQTLAKVTRLGPRRFPFGMYVPGTILTEELIERGLRTGGAPWIFERAIEVREERIKAREKRGWLKPFLELFRRPPNYYGQGSPVKVVDK